MKKEVAFTFLFFFLHEFKLNHNFVSWQYSATSCLDDTRRPHIVRVILQKLTDLGLETLPHPLYYPEFSPTNCHFFKHLNTFLFQETLRRKGKVENILKTFRVLSYRHK